MLEIQILTEKKKYKKKTRKEQSKKKKEKESNRGAGYKSVSKYIRDVALGKQITARVDIDAVYNLRKIGNNLNQIAKQINTEKRDETMLSLKYDIDALLWSVKDVIRKIIYSP